MFSGNWYLPNVDDTSADNYCSFVMAAGKSGSCRMLESLDPPQSKKSRKEWNQEKLRFSTGKPEVEVLDQDIWKEFPEDLFEPVIARLPIATFFCFRSVCRKWNSLLDSQTFAQRCAEIPQRNPWFYAFTHDNVNAGSMCYDPSIRKWHHPTLSVQKRLLIRLHLLAVWSVNAWSCIAVGMTRNRNSTTGVYRVMWVGGDGECEVYDSVKNSWN
ncbi:hypothetical protein V6N13_017353 [Hibiscus sabdariffa]